jgi:hypothetical protein
MGKFLFLGAIILAVILFGPFSRMLKGTSWRVSAGMAAIAAFALTAFCLVERRWAGVVVAGVLGLWLATTARHPRVAEPAGRRRAPPVRRDGMSLAEARSILGVDADASAADIRAAYKRLMQRVHPDHGGAPGLAAQLNAARDRLLKKP